VCPLVTEGHCPLVEGADVVISTTRLADDGEVLAALRYCHPHGLIVEGARLGYSPPLRPPSPKSMPSSRRASLALLMVDQTLHATTAGPRARRHASRCHYRLRKEGLDNRRWGQVLGTGSGLSRVGRGGSRKG
jgi:hypothetical protein